jgi:hypothetical protein
MKRHKPTPKIAQIKVQVRVWGCDLQIARMFQLEHFTLQKSFGVSR